MERLLSIIVPVYNGASYIDSLVREIEKQKSDLEQYLKAFGHFENVMELIFVDDGSKDDTRKACMQQEEKHKWIRVLHTENHGVSHARNHGIEASKGHWVQFLDVDDTLGEGMLKGFAENCGSFSEPFQNIVNIDKKYKKKPDLIICGCNRLHSGAEPISCGPKKNAFLNEMHVLQLLDQMKMEDRYWILDYCWNKWYRRDILEKNKLRFKETLSLGEDFVFNAHYMCYVQQMVLLSTCYYQYRVGDTGLVSKFQPEPWVSRLALYDEQKKLYQCKGLWESNQTLIGLHYGQIIFGDIRTIYSKRCHLNYKEKQNYMDHMSKSSLYDMMLRYLKTKKSLAFLLYYGICKTKNSALILAMIYLESRLRK